MLIAMTPHLHLRKSASPDSPAKTIAVPARGHGRSSRLRLKYPDQSDHPTYDAALARELLARTGELPDSRRALIVLLTEYRHALHDLCRPG
jgi:hypothetical protein